MSIKKVYLKFASKNEAMQVLQSAGFILDIESEQYYFPGRDISVSVDGHKMVDTGIEKTDEEGNKYNVFEPSKEWYIKMIATALPSFGKYEIPASEAPSTWA